MYKFLKLLTIILITLYPFVVYFGLNFLTTAQLGFVLLAIFGLRVMHARRKKTAKSWPVILAVVIGASLAGLSWLFDKPEYLLWYPVGLNAALFVIFTTSLIFPPTVVEYMARLTEKDLPDKAIPYIRNVTVVWSIFFVINACIASWTVLSGDLKIWTLYNGLIAYLLMGLIFAIEFLVRKKVRGKD